MALNLPIVLQQSIESDSVFMVELYDIQLPNGYLHFCACDVDIEFRGVTYVAVPITREAIKSTSDSTVDNTKLTVSNFDNSFTVALLSGYNFVGCKCAIYQIMYPESLTDDDLYINVFWGTLDAPVLNQKEATFSVDVVAPTMSLENARSMALPCQAQFADGESCMADASVRTGVVQGGSTTTMVYTAIPASDDYWKHGLITVNSETRMITESSAGKVTVNYPFYNVPSGNFVIQCGCDKSHSNCGVHGQQQNYSGMLSIAWEYSVKS